MSTLVFSKATRRKDVKHVAKLKAPVVIAGESRINADDHPGDSVQDELVVDLAAEEAAELDDDEKKSCQATINLVGK